MLMFDVAGGQINGSRDYQEDAFLTTHLGDKNEGASLAILADGMGGHAAGNVASNMAVQSFNKHVTSSYPSPALPAVLREAVLQANGSIGETVRETAALRGMGCTLVGAVCEDKYLRWVSVGDSHVYLIRKNEIRKKNADHSYGGFLDRMAAEGNPIEPEAGFARNMLMSALTGDEIADIDCPETPLELQAGDRIILSSDGLDTLSHGKILAFSGQAKTPKECVEALLKGVEDAKMPRQDNTTVIVIDVSEKPGSKPAVTPAPPPAAVTASPPSKSAGVPSAQATRSLPVEDDQAPRNRFAGLAVAIVVVATVIAGAGYWFLQGGKKPPSPAPVAVGAGEGQEPQVEHVPEERSTVPEPAPEAAPQTEPEPTLQPVPAVQPKVETAPGKSVPFSDRLKGGAAGPLMVWVPAGEYVMGGRTSAAFEEMPQHRVMIRRFAASVYEITVAEYARFAAATGRRAPKVGDLTGEGYPVFNVSWNDALDYAKWLSTQTGHSYRVPSEAEWEYLARGGSDAAYPWGRELGSNNAHCFACDSGLDPRRPTRVGRFAPNGFGIHDTAGNLQEWVYDCYHNNYDGAPNDGSVFEGGDCTTRVVRGGAYTGGPKSLRSSARDKFRYDQANDQVGIRVVRDQ